MLKYKDKIISVFINILIVITTIAIFFVGYNFYQLKILRKDYANIFGYTMFEVATGSMSGTIEAEDLIIVELTNNVKKNDIITFKSNDSFITHRVIEVRDNILITKGDSNNSVDNPINKKQVIGKVIKVIPGVGVWKEVLSTPKVTIAILATLIIFSIALNNSEAKRKRKKGNQILIEKNQKKQKSKRKAKKNKESDLELTNKLDLVVEKDDTIDLTKALEIVDEKEKLKKKKKTSKNIKMKNEEITKDNGDEENNKREEKNDISLV